MTEFKLLSEKNRLRYLKVITPIGNFLARIGIHPNVLSVCGLIFSLIAGVMYGLGLFFLASFVVILAGVCDTLDGQLARQTGKNSKFGAFFDSTLDRYSDLSLLIGMAWFFSGYKGLLGFNGHSITSDSHPWTILFIILAMTGSFMVSYSRARAEGLGLECNIGFMQRPERILLIILGSLLSVIPGIGYFIIKITLFILALSTNITAIHRILYVRNQLSNGEKTQP